MSFGETKVYFDGSHYVAIPHTTRLIKRRPLKEEEKITVIQDEVQDLVEVAKPCISLDKNSVTNKKDIEVDDIKINKETLKKERKITKKELFNELYKKYINSTRNERKKLITREMTSYFETLEECKNYVQLQMERKQRNLICRRVRMIRKANLADFNYFCTFTYDSKIHTEVTFRRKLIKTLSYFATTRSWKYMGVWERAPETNRLHFHGLLEIPNGTMPGKLIEKLDFSFSAHKRTTTIQNTFFNERFGRSDFQSIDTHQDLMKEISYICKYLEKTEEKIVYSKNLYQFFISDIMDEDIACQIGHEEMTMNGYSYIKKLVLFDDFKCFDEGVLIGKVCKNVIAKMRKCN